MKSKTEPQEIVVEVTEEEFQADLERGLTEDEVMHPGRHVFRRGGFLARHQLTSDEVAIPGTVRVALELDADVYVFLRERAERTESTSYQAQINAILREAMAREKA